MSHNDYLIDYALKAAQGRYSSSTDATNAGELTAAGWPGHGLRKPIQRLRELCETLSEQLANCRRGLGTRRIARWQNGPMRSALILRKPKAGARAS